MAARISLPMPSPCRFHGQPRAGLDQLRRREVLGHDVLYAEHLTVDQRPPSGSSSRAAPRTRARDQKCLSELARQVFGRCIRPGHGERHLTRVVDRLRRQLCEPHERARRRDSAARVEACARRGRTWATASCACTLLPLDGERRHAVFDHQRAGHAEDRRRRRRPNPSRGPRPPRPCVHRRGW